MVSALAHVERNDISNYDIALNHVNDALEIDPLYHNAFAVRQFLLVHLYPEKAHDALIEMETHYSDVLSEGTDRGNIAEYYQFHGLLNLHADRYSEAIEDFKHAECYGYDPVYTKMNIAVSLYSEARHLKAFGVLPYVTLLS